MFSEEHNDDMIPVVNVYYQDNWSGVYKVKLVGELSMVLQHGAISFPVGTALKVRFRRLVESKSIHKHILAIVRNNSANGMLLRLQSLA